MTKRSFNLMDTLLRVLIEISVLAPDSPTLYILSGIPAYIYFLWAVAVLSVRNSFDISKPGRPILLACCWREGGRTGSFLRRPFHVFADPLRWRNIEPGCSNP